MQSVNDSHPTDTFTDGPIKPSCYSVTEKPTPIPTPPKTLISYRKRVSTCSYEKAYDFFTSLPVSAALLALIISQGASINNSMWYINYTALAAILLTCIAVGISYLSVPASHRFCESVFLTLYTPASQILNISVSLHDSHDDDDTRKSKLAKHETSTSVKQVLLVSAMAAANHGLTIFSLSYVILVSSAYHILSTQLNKIYHGNDKASNNEQVFHMSASSSTTLTLISFITVLDIYFFGMTGLCSLAYFVTIDPTLRHIIIDCMENKNIEIMEGLDKYFAQGIFQLAEVTIVLAVIYAKPYLCLLYFAVFYFNIYLPIIAFRQNGAKIQTESLCLSNFPKATAAELAAYDDVCAVCLCSMKYARVTPCKHIFHGKCLKDCLTKKAQCPMCNAQVL